MASTHETGHAKNVATFEELIGYCNGYGAAYNPTKAALKLPALTTQLAAANLALQSVKTTKTTYDNATNAREVVVKQVRPLVTRVVNALSATDALRQTVDDTKSINLKIQGRRARAVEKPTAEELAAGATPVKTVSTSQQSYDKIVDHFAQLITTLTAEPKYAPNENELKVTALNTLLADLRAKNTAVISATTAVSNARIARNKALYVEGQGIIDTALAVKTYVKSLFGPTSPQYKQLSVLKFTRPKTE